MLARINLIIMLRLLAVLFFLLISFGYSLSPQEERQLIRDIAIKATLKAFMRETDKRFEAIDKRFELMDKRITELREDMNKRFEQIDKRFEQINNELNRLIQIMVGIFAGQIALVVAVIGFAWWDRRTIIRKATEETVDYLEREGKLRKLIEVLREKAKTDKELEAILKKYGLL